MQPVHDVAGKLTLLLENGQELADPIAQRGVAQLAPHLRELRQQTLAFGKRIVEKRAVERSAAQPRESCALGLPPLGVGRLGQPYRVRTNVFTQQESGLHLVAQQTIAE